MSRNRIRLILLVLTIAVASVVVWAQQPVTVTSGTVTANAGTNLNTSALVTSSNFTGVLGTTLLVTTSTLADDLVNTTDVLNTVALGYMFDGVTWDRVRGDSTNGLLVNLGTNNDVDTELPAAASLADGTTNPTVPGVGAFLMCWNGSTWDRCLSATTTEATHDSALTPSSTKGNVPMLLAADQDGAALPNAVSAEGDAIIPKASLSGVQYVMAVNEDGSTVGHFVCDSGCSSSSGFTDNSAFTFGTTAVNPIAGVFDDTSTNTATENSAAVARITQNKALHINLRNAAGTEIGTSSNPVQVTLANTGANATAVKVDNSAVTQPVSAASLPLPTGAATAAKQPALGTAGSASADVITVQGVTSMTPLKVDGSGVTQPVSGTVTANAGSGTFTVSGTVTVNAGTGTFTNQQSNTQVDTDTGAGTQNTTLFGIALPASGGAVAGGTSTNPIRVDPTGTTTQPVSGTVTANQGGSNWSMNVAQINGVTPLMGAGNGGTGSQRVNIATDQAALVGLGIYTEDAAETAGGNLSMAGSVRRDTLASSAGSSGDNATINTDANGALYVTPVATASGGASTCYITSAASTNATNCKNAAGNLYGVEVVNTTSTIYYLRLYNLAASPTCSSATGFVRTIPIPNGAGAGAGIANFYTVGEAYGTGLGFCLTGGGSSTDNTNAATGVYVTLHYK